MKLLVQVLAGALDAEQGRELGNDVLDALGPSGGPGGAATTTGKPGNFNLVNEVQRTGAKSAAPRIFLLQAADGRTLRRALLRPGTGTYEHLNEELAGSGGGSSQRPSTTRTGVRGRRNYAPEDAGTTYLTTGAAGKIDGFNRLYDDELESITFSTRPGSRPGTRVGPGTTNSRPGTSQNVSKLADSP